MPIKDQTRSEVVNLIPVFYLIFLAFKATCAEGCEEAKSCQRPGNPPANANRSLVEHLQSMVVGKPNILTLQVDWATPRDATNLNVSCWKNAP